MSVCVFVCERECAVGLADCVSAERIEECGDNVAYRIRMENKISNMTTCVCCPFVFVCVYKRLFVLS